MSKDKNIDAVFKILPLFELAKAEGTELAIQSYLNYLSRMYIQLLGTNNDDWAQLINGLMKIGVDAEHSQVKRIVLHLTNQMNEGGVVDGI